MKFTFDKGGEEISSAEWALATEKVHSGHEVNGEGENIVFFSLKWTHDSEPFRLLSDTRPAAAHLSLTATTNRLSYQKPCLVSYQKHMNCKQHFLIGHKVELGNCVLHTCSVSFSSLGPALISFLNITYFYTEVQILSHHQILHEIWEPVFSWIP